MSLITNPFSESASFTSSSRSAIIPLVIKIPSSFKAFSDIEPLTPDFHEKLARAENFASQNGDELTEILTGVGKAPMRNLTYYFIHRYFLSTDFSYRECALFAVGSAALILTLAHLSDGITHENLISEAKYFSKNIEYSTENVEIVLANLAE